MNRRVERGPKLFWKRLSPRYLKMIVTLIGGFILFNAAIYLSIQYIFYPIKATLATETTTTTTTSTSTTMKSTTEKSFGKFLFQKNPRNSFLLHRSWMFF